MIFALKYLGLWGYIDDSIFRLVFLVAIKKEVTVTIFTKAKQEAQDKIDLQTKDNAHVLRKMGWMYNKTVQLWFNVIQLSSEA